MNRLNQQLRDAFLFQATDLRANRGGQLSKRQQAMLGAAKSNSNLALGMFLLVMLGTGGFIAYSTSSGTPSTSGTQSNDALLTTLIALVAILVVSVIGYLISRKYMATLGGRQISVAKGRASVGSNAENNYQVKIGSTKLRVPLQGQLASFDASAEYRVYYIAGPVPIILSGESIVEGVDPDEVALENAEEISGQQDPAMRLAKGGRTVLFVLMFVIVQVIAVGMLASQVAGILRWVIVGALVVEAVGFVGWVLWRFGREA
ncbi:MAG: hypothetical protein ABIQ44_09890 [Chloroflexia bacterium]